MTFSTLWILIKDPFYRIRLFMAHFFLYVQHPFFFVGDVCLFFYRFIVFTPRVFKHEPDSLTFGELTYAGLSSVMAAFPHLKGKYCLDLGSGHGKTCLWLSSVYGMTATGIEIVPSFVRISRLLAAFLRCKKVAFIEGDFFEIPFPSVDLVIFPSTCFLPEDSYRIAEKIKLNLPHAMVWSLSEPLPGIPVQCELPIMCTWGIDVLYVQN